MKKIEIAKMVLIEGGVSRAEYCETLTMIITCNPITDSMLYAYAMHCAAYYQ